jgi:hypothetical protein
VGAALDNAYEPCANDCHNLGLLLTHGSGHIHWLLAFGACRNIVLLSVPDNLGRSRGALALLAPVTTVFLYTMGKKTKVPFVIIRVPHTQPVHLTIILAPFWAQKNSRQTTESYSYTSFHFIFYQSNPYLSLDTYLPSTYHLLTTICLY